MALVARDVNGGKDDRVFLVTKKGADKAKLVTIEGAGTVATGGACHYGLMAARVVATKDGFAVSTHFRKTQKAFGDLVVHVVSPKGINRTSVGAVAVSTTDTDSGSQSVPALAWRGLGGLLFSEAEGTLTVISEADTPAGSAIQAFTFKP